MATPAARRAGDVAVRRPGRSYPCRWPVPWPNAAPLSEALLSKPHIAPDTPAKLHLVRPGGLSLLEVCCDRRSVCRRRSGTLADAEVVSLLHLVRRCQRQIHSTFVHAAGQLQQDPNARLSLQQSYFYKIVSLANPSVRPATCIAEACACHRYV